MDSEVFYSFFTSEESWEQGKYKEILLEATHETAWFDEGALVEVGLDRFLYFLSSLY